MCLPGIKCNYLSFYIEIKFKYYDSNRGVFLLISPFIFSRIPVIHFGAGEFNTLPDIIGRMGKTVLIITGSHSFQSSGKKDQLESALKKKSINFFSVQVKGEPSPGLIDTVVAQFRDSGIDVVCGIGGGSVIDAGKAVSAMLLHDDSVFEYLEGVGTGKQHDGDKAPFIAVPTTAGTGSEATKNAVLSEVGQDGFKKSLRHDNFVPDIAVVDPELMLPCPPLTTAASGMDALSQLLESYVSTRASKLTDSLAYDGLSCVVHNLIPACTDGGG
jgi:alcohol dehydrogenase